MYQISGYLKALHTGKSAEQKSDNQTILDEQALDDSGEEEIPV